VNKDGWSCPSRVAWLVFVDGYGGENNINCWLNSNSFSLFVRSTHLETGVEKELKENAAACFSFIVF
jgi:hypothetical protein